MLSVSEQEHDAHDAGSTATAVATRSLAVTTQAIEAVRIGTRVVAENPQPWEFDDSLPEPDAATWRLLRAVVARSDGGLVNVELIRPAAWIAEHALAAGQTLELHLEELNVSGTAWIEAIEPCPEIEPGSGRVVLGRFISRDVEELLRLTLSDDTTIDVTPAHLFWSQSRRDWIAAGELEIGEELNGLGDRVWLVSKASLGSTPRVYNLEVHGEHVYRVAHSGVLVHNTYDGKQRLSSRNPVPKEIREAYEDIKLGKGIPRLENGQQKVFQAKELKRISGSRHNRWEGSLEYDVPGTDHRILRRPDGVLGYVEYHNYSKVRPFPAPWYPDGY